MIWGIAWWGINIFFVAVPPCVYLLAMSFFFFREMSCYILLPQSRFIRCLGDFSVLKRTVLLYNLDLDGRYRKLAGTTTLAYRIIINCTTAEWVVKFCCSYFSDITGRFRRRVWGLISSPTGVFTTHWGKSSIVSQSINQAINQSINQLINLGTIFPRTRQIFTLHLALFGVSCFV